MLRTENARWMLTGLLLALVQLASGGEVAPPNPNPPAPPQPAPTKTPEGKPVTHARKVPKDPNAPPKFTNKLARETSPYLLQHAHNPVDWYPWGPEAFEKARKENKPVFLSVGYSACHWCHVMEHETFEDEDAAKVINLHTIPIKVDREERPDVDDIYMKYVHLSGKQGGWPMTVFLTPEAVPFFGGTYYPKEHFMSMLEQLGKVWKERGDELRTKGPEIVRALQHEVDAEYREPERPLSAETLGRAVDFVAGNFDDGHGGLQSERKFPPHATLDFLLAALSSKGPQLSPARQAKARQMLVLTLDFMQRGGIHDQLGGGFHRYATDPVWFLPHFEKMLYDNAQLAGVYAKAAALTGDKEYERTARGIFEWVLREMASPDGGYYSAYDADSDGEEGLFYVWNRKEVDELLGADSALFCKIFRVRPEGNYSDEATRRPTGLNIPHLEKPLAAWAEELKLDEAALREKIAGWKKTLMAARIKRAWPALDDKILTSWNALMVGAFARGGLYLKEPRYTEAGVKAAEWLLKNQRTAEGRWLATHRKGESKLPAYLDDHAYLARACMDLFDVTQDQRWVKESAALVTILDQHFWDTKRGGYYFTADDHEKLLVRVKNPSDNATPSGNGIAAQALVRLSVATGKKEYVERAHALFKAFHVLMDLAPLQVETLLVAYRDELTANPEAAAAAIVEAGKDVVKVQRGPIITEIFAGLDRASAGGRIPVAVRIALDAGYHIYAHKAAALEPNPNKEGVLPTTLRLRGPEGVTLEGVKYPEGKPWSAPGEKDQVLTYQGESVLIGGWLVLPNGYKQAHVQFEVELEYQACNERHCLAPERVSLKIGVPVNDTPAEALKINDKIFKDMDLK